LCANSTLKLLRLLNASARACLSACVCQVSNAMTHATDSLEYLSRLRDPQVFRFCAIPQVMAIATLAECYDNPKVFKAVVKIPRSMRCARCSRVCSPLLGYALVGADCPPPRRPHRRSARIMVTTKGMAETVAYFRLYGQQLEKKARACGLRAQCAARPGGSSARVTPRAATQVRAEDPNAKAMQKALAALYASLDVRRASGLCGLLARQCASEVLSSD
jgi:hypothetical protein